jgi:hypothetical protein
MPGGRPVSVKPWSGWFRLGQVDWLQARSRERAGVTQSQIVRDGIDLMTAIIDGNQERVTDLIQYVKTRYDKENCNV